MVSTFIRLKEGKHVGTCNIQCLNAIIYKKFSKKNEKIMNKYVEFSSHQKNFMV